VLPHVELEERQHPDGHVALLVEQLVGHELPGGRVEGEDRPAGTLDPGGGGGELPLESLEGSEGVRDRRGDLTLGSPAPVGGEVLPEDRVVDVATEVEGEVLLIQVDRREVAGLPSGSELVECRVGTVDVGLVVLVVVELHDLRTDVRLERRVVVGQLGQGVDSHVFSSFSSGAGMAWRCLHPTVRVRARHPGGRQRVAAPISSCRAAGATPACSACAAASSAGVTGSTRSSKKKRDRIWRRRSFR